MRDRCSSDMMGVTAAFCGWRYKPMPTSDERRRFHRFPFDAECELMLKEQPIPCHLMDLSINGLLVQVDEGPGLPVECGNAPALASDRNASTTSLSTYEGLSVRSASISGLIACRLEAIDPDSFAQLKALVEKNLGDVLLLDRELTQLDYWPGLSISPSD